MTAAPRTTGWRAPSWRQVRRYLDPAGRAGRVWNSVPAAVQITVAAVVAFAVAHYWIGHAAPVIAVTVTISSLGFTRDARPVKVLETAIGVTVGIALSETLLLLFGQGVWQLGVVIFATLLVARFLSGSAAFAIAAAVQSALISVLPAPAGGAFTRTEDAIVGGLVALVCTALIPRDPRRATRREARRLFAEFLAVVASLVMALQLGDARASGRALARARATGPVLDAWRSSLDSAIAIARISPFLRRHLPELREQAAILSGMELAVRNLRVVARRTDYIVRDGEARVELAELLSSLSSGVNVLGQGLSNGELRMRARQSLILVAVKLDPQLVLPGSTVMDASLVMQLRPLVVDLLTATGMPLAEAQATLPSSG
ncbi:FUSC family protein [Compostimonas suwonensis]|uniref:Uncharacterized membrane protein YgaE (UPF0421/DUF939 family) n=1 Tax=Compostimonas suwonensis TaxID=1048394 RepID=A0A2M9BVH6_9MICO|nr:FUSC family protein [Compostimonas suwonensis]PJJ61942.1 uncharacterized membrane protein YgaE (UPF0421/DUF939 family) [Compostimonas suwonensis]